MSVCVYVCMFVCLCVSELSGYLLRHTFNYVGQNLSRAFNSRSGRAYTLDTICNAAKHSNLKLKTLQ